MRIVPVSLARVTLAASAIGLALSLAACGKEQPAPAPAPASAPQPVLVPAPPPEPPLATAPDSDQDGVVDRSEAPAPVGMPPAPAPPPSSGTLRLTLTNINERVLFLGKAKLSPRVATAAASFDPAAGCRQRFLLATAIAPSGPNPPVHANDSGDAHWTVDNIQFTYDGQDYSCTMGKPVERVPGSDHTLLGFDMEPVTADAPTPPAGN